MIDKYKRKAEILTKFFNIYGYGHFDLSLEEITYIIQLLYEKRNDAYLEVNLQQFYERLEKQRMG